MGRAFFVRQDSFWLVVGGLWTTGSTKAKSRMASSCGVAALSLELQRD